MPFHSRNDLLVRTQDGRHVVLEEPLEFVTAAGLRYRAPAGTEADGASIPPEVWPCLPPFGQYWLASVLHDAAYRGTLEQRTSDGQWLGADLTRDQADTLFLEAMASLGVDELTRTIIHQAVVRFGARAFRKHLG